MLFITASGSFNLIFLTNDSLNKRVGRRNPNQIPPESDSESGSSAQVLKFNPAPDSHSGWPCSGSGSLSIFQ